MQTSASKSCACAISSIESAMTSREMSDARIPGVPCDWLSETAIVLKQSARPFAADTPSLTRSASSRWLRLQGIVPVQGGVDPHELTLGAAVEGELVAPLQPGKIVAIGLNYLDHIRESKLPQPARPLVFAKFPSSVTGPNDPIVVDVGLTTHVDWEVELGVIVGRRMRRVGVGAALDYVF